jgi:prevent-host-death family protein
MVNYMTMIVVNIAEVKAKLSEYLDAVAQGERVLICKRNQPVAELRAVETARTEPRPVGLSKGRLTVSDAFFQALPDEVLDMFEGAERPPRDLRVAEAPPRGGYRTRKASRKRTS